MRVPSCRIFVSSRTWNKRFNLNHLLFCPCMGGLVTIGLFLILSTQHMEWSLTAKEIFHYDAVMVRKLEDLPITPVCEYHTPRWHIWRQQFLNYEPLHQMICQPYAPAAFPPVFQRTLETGFETSLEEVEMTDINAPAWNWTPLIFLNLVG